MGGGGRLTPGMMQRFVVIMSFPVFTPELHLLSSGL